MLAGERDAWSSAMAENSRFSPKNVIIAVFVLLLVGAGGAGQEPHRDERAAPIVRRREEQWGVP